MKPKLLNIMMGMNNPDLQTGFESVFECRHIDWTAFDLVQHQQPMMESIVKAHRFDPRNPSGEIRTENRMKSTKSQFDFALLQIFNEFKPDIVFMHLQRGEVFSQNTIDEMNKTAKLINWCGDVREELPQHYIDLGKEIALTLFTNMEDVLKLRDAGVNADFLQVGFDSQKFNPEGPTDTVTYPEIIFMGSNYELIFPLSKYRETMVKTLKEKFGNKFGVYGSNWGTIGSGSITNYADEGKAYRSCKIAISLSHFERGKYASDRLFRILGSGAFCLSHQYPGLNIDFEIGKEIDVFSTINELINKIEYYLENEKIRKDISDAGCKKARDKFTWHSFAENLKLITDKL